MSRRKHPGQFTYSKGGGNATTAMAAAGVVCLQEFAQYDDWRIEKNIELLLKQIGDLPKPEQLARDRRAALRSVHAVLRQPGTVPGRRNVLAEGLSDLAQRGHRQPG